jgi:hypothetical protein
VHGWVGKKSFGSKGKEKRRKKESSFWFVKIERDRHAARSPRHSLCSEDRRRGRQRKRRVKAKNFCCCPACRFARVNQSTNQKYKPELLSPPIRRLFVPCLFMVVAPPCPANDVSPRSWLLACFTWPGLAPACGQRGCPGGWSDPRPGSSGSGREGCCGAPGSAMPRGCAGGPGRWVPVRIGVR